MPLDMWVDVISEEWHSTLLVFCGVQLPYYDDGGYRPMNREFAEVLVRRCELHQLGVVVCQLRCWLGLKLS